MLVGGGFVKPSLDHLSMHRIPSHLLRALLAAFLVAAGISQTWAQLFPIRQDGRWGLINNQGSIVAQPHFESVQPLPSGNALIVQDGKFGLLDATGRTLIPAHYTFLKHLGGNIWASNLGGSCEGSDCDGGKWGLYNTATQAEIAPAYNLILRDSLSNHFLVNVGGNCNYSDCKGGLWGLVDTLGNILLPPIYDRIQPLDPWLAQVQKDSLWGVYDFGREIITVQPDYQELYFVTDWALCAKRGDSAALIHLSGDTLVGFRFEDYRPAGFRFFQFQQNKRWGLVDSTGVVRIPASFDQVLVRNTGWVEVWLNGLLGFYTLEGQLIAPPAYRDAPQAEGRIAMVTQGLFWGAIDRNGKEIVPIRYARGGAIGDSLVYFEDGNTLKWANLSGKVVRGINFDKIAPFQDGIARVQIGGEVGLVNQEGNWLVPPKYTEMNVFRNVAQARLADGDWIYTYFDDDGRPSQVKRLIVQRDDEYYDAESVANNWRGGARGGTANLAESSTRGWFIGGRRQWGLRDEQSGVVRIAPKYITVSILPNTNLSLVEGKISNSENTAFGIVNTTLGKETAAPMFSKILSADFVAASMARAIYAGNGFYTLVNRSGYPKSLQGVKFIRPCSGGLYAACQGGTTKVMAHPRLDTINMYTVQPKGSLSFVRQYEVVEGGKWGYLDSTGIWAKTAEYEQALPFHNGLAPVKKNGKWGVINRQFQLVVQPIYDFVEELYAEDGNALLAVGYHRNRYGFIDSLGEIVVAPQYQEAGAYCEGLVRVRIDGLWGYADMSGALVIPPRYRYAADFHEGRSRVRNSRNWGYIDTEGNAITPEHFLRAGDFHEGKAWVQERGMMGYIGLDGERLIRANYSEATDFVEGRATVRQKGNYGIIDEAGKWILPPRYFRIQPFRDSLALVQDGAVHGIVRHDGTWLVKPQYKALAPFSEDLAAYREGMKYGFLDRAGAVAIPATFANVKSFSSGRAPIFVQGRWGYIDTAGTVVVEPKYQSVGGFSEDHASVSKQRKWGFIDKAGKLVIPMVYDNVTNFECGRAAVQVANVGWGFVNPEGTLVVPCMYDEVGKYKGSIAPVCETRKWGVINQYGALVTLMKYDQVGNYDQGLAKVNLQRSVGIINQNGKVLVPSDFDSVKMLGGLIQVEVNDRLGYLSLQGDWVWQPTK
jgi:hypothetical protein